MLSHTRTRGLRASFLRPLEEPGERLARRAARRGGAAGKPPSRRRKHRRRPATPHVTASLRIRVLLRARPRRLHQEKRISCVASNRRPRLFVRTTPGGPSSRASRQNVMNGSSLSAGVEATAHALAAVRTSIFSRWSGDCPARSSPSGHEAGPVRMLHLRVDDLVAADPCRAPRAPQSGSPARGSLHEASGPPARSRQPPASWGISIVRVPDHSPWRLHSAVADTSELPPFIRAWNAR